METKDFEEWHQASFGQVEGPIESLTGEEMPIKYLSHTQQSRWEGWQAALAHKGLLEVLEWYADQFCEYGASNTGCGKYDDDTCSGCKARAAIQAAKASS